MTEQEKLILQKAKAGAAMARAKKFITDMRNSGESAKSKSSILA